MEKSTFRRPKNQPKITQKKTHPGQGKVGPRGGTQRCEVGPRGGTQRWDPEVGPRGGTYRWDPEVGPGGGTQRWEPEAPDVRPRGLEINRIVISVEIFDIPTLHSELSKRATQR